MSWLGTWRDRMSSHGRTWRERADLARLSVVRHGKQAASTIHRVATQSAERAKLQGARLARHIIGVQKAAGATPKLMRESAKSVANRHMLRDGDRAWQKAYVAEAGKHVDGLVPAREPGPERVPAAPARPAWPYTAGPIDLAYFRSDAGKAAGEKSDPELEAG